MPRLLVFGGDPLAVTGLTLLLAGDGHDVASFTDEAQALDALEHETFDAVLADFETRSLDRVAVPRAALRRQPAACVVLISTTAEQDARVLSDLGPCIVAEKPLDYDQLARALMACIARPHTSSRPSRPQLVSMNRRGPASA